MTKRLGPGWLGGTLLFALAACSSSEPSSREGLFVISGGNQSDTVDAVLATPLTVRLETDSAPEHVNFVFRADPLIPGEPSSVLFSQWPDCCFSSVVSLFRAGATTESVWVKLGTMVGTARAHILAGDYTTTATWSVFPGKPAGVRAIPRDTAIRVGGVVQSRSQLADRYGNPLGGSAAALAPAIGGITVSGSTVTGTAVGRAAVVATLGATHDTMWISVVPTGGYSTSTLSYPPDFISEIATMDFDGRNRRTVPVANVTVTGLDWSPDGNFLAIDDQNLGRLRIANREGVLRQLPAGEGLQLYAEYAPDGAWLYYSAAANAWTIRRILPDGTGQSERVTEIPEGYVALTFSPDHRYYAVVQVGGAPNNNQLLRRYDRVTGEWLDLAVSGHSPSWSSDGQWIAYVNDQDASVHVIRPDGTDDRTLTRPEDWFRRSIDWSGDSQWILAVSLLRRRVELIHRDTGELMPLPSGTSGAVAWRP